MRRVAAMAAILLTATGPAQAARLCRDGKGLFTPCIGERPPAEPRTHHRDQPIAPSSEPQVGSARTGRAADPRSARPPLVAKARLCRDSKGLFTPCPR